MKAKKLNQKQHPDHTAVIVRVRKIAGQLDGIEKMINDGRYCPDILQQIKAASSALNALKTEILKTHLNECLADSARSKDYSRLLEQVLELVRAQLKS